MERSRVLSVAAVSAVALGAGIAAFLRAAPIEPFLVAKVVLEMRGEHSALYHVTLTARGGGTVEEVRVEPLAGPVRLIGGPSLRGPSLKSGTGWGFSVELEGPATARGTLRVVQRGPGARSYDVALEPGL